MRRDIMGKSNKNRRFGNLMEPMSRMTMDFHGRLIDSQGRIVDPGHYFAMDDHYMENERFLYPHDMIRNRHGMYGFMQGDNVYGNNMHRGMFADGMYRDMHHSGMHPSGYMHGGSMQNRPMMYMQGRYPDDSYFMNYHPSMSDPPVIMHSHYNDHEGRHGMYGRPSESYGSHGRHGDAHSMPRRVSDTHSPQRRPSESHIIQVRPEGGSSRKTSRAKLFPDDKNTDSA